MSDLSFILNKDSLKIEFFCKKNYFFEMSLLVTESVVDNFKISSFQKVGPFTLSLFFHFNVIFSTSTSFMCKICTR